MAGATFDLVVAANRLPVARAVGASGERCWRPSPGGLVSTLEPVMQSRHAGWVGWPGEPGSPPPSFRAGGMSLFPVGLSEEEVAQYYDGFSNATLWPLYHGAVVPAQFHRSWWRAYRRVNDRFAREVAQVTAGGGTVWVHDYHLQLVPETVRLLRPDVRIGWFDHVPFPPVELFEELPWRRALLQGLLGADVLGFQQASDADNFQRACRRLLGLAAHEGTVVVPSAGDRHARAVRVAAVPVSVDFERLDTLARSRAVAAAAARFRDSLGGPDVLVLGVDRLDYTKGIRHRLKAYAELLEDGAIDPRGTTFVQVALPSRERIPAYRRLREDVQETVRRINDTHKAQGPPAVHLLQEHYPPDARAAMFLAADLMLVTPLRDGMNLVAKEYVACRHDLGGALVLSELSGAWQELREAFGCNPHDIDGLKTAVMSAVHAPEGDRRRRMEVLRRRVRDHDAQRWARVCLDALAPATSPGPPPA